MRLYTYATTVALLYLLNWQRISVDALPTRVDISTPGVRCSVTAPAGQHGNHKVEDTGYRRRRFGKRSSANSGRVSHAPILPGTGKKPDFKAAPSLSQSTPARPHPSTPAPEKSNLAPQIGNTPSTATSKSATIAHAPLSWAAIARQNPGQSSKQPSSPQHSAAPEPRPQSQPPSKPASVGHGPANWAAAVKQGPGLSLKQSSPPQQSTAPKPQTQGPPPSKPASFGHVPLTWAAAVKQNPAQSPKPSRLPLHVGAGVRQPQAHPPSPGSPAVSTSAQGETPGSAPGAHKSPVSDNAGHQSPASIPAQAAWTGSTDNAKRFGMTGQTHPQPLTVKKNPQLDGKARSQSPERVSGKVRKGPQQPGKDGRFWAANAEADVDRRRTPAEKKKAEELAKTGMAQLGAQKQNANLRAAVHPSESHPKHGNVITMGIAEPGADTMTALHVGTRKDESGEIQYDGIRAKWPNQDNTGVNQVPQPEANQGSEF